MCFQDTQEWHQQFCRPVYSLTVIISTISIQNRFREHDKNISFPATPFKHSLFQLPSPSSKISRADPLVACLFWSSKMPGPVQFKLQSHIQFIMNTLSGCPVRGLGLKGFEWGGEIFDFFHTALFWVLSSCSVSQPRKKEQGWWYLGQTSPTEEGFCGLLCWLSLLVLRGLVHAWNQTLHLTWGSWIYFCRSTLGWILPPHSSHAWSIYFSLNPLQKLPLAK